MVVNGTRKVSNTKITTCLEGEAYAEAWKAFRNVTNQRQIMLSWYEQNLSQILPSAEYAEIMSVGAANGSFDLATIPFLLNSIALINYSACEPSDVLRAEFEHEAKNFAGQERVTFKFYGTPWQELVTDRQFDLILMSHCLYYFNDPGAAIAHAAAMIGTTGKILVFHSTDKGLAEIRSRFTSPLTGSPYHYLNADEVVSIASQLGMNVSTTLLPCAIDVSQCVIENRDLALMSWLVNADVRNAPSATTDEIAQYLIEIGEQSEDKLVVQHPVAAMLIKNEL